MTLEEELHETMLALYRKTGEETDYWPHYFRRAVIKHTGLVWAKKSLIPKKLSAITGLQSLLEAGKPELSLEWLVLQPKFASLFTDAELAEARKRQTLLMAAMRKVAARKDRLYPDELDLGRTYPEGAKRVVRVNAYERNQAARDACIAHFGVRCKVCDFDFEAKYGTHGKGFIHVHHTKPISTIGANYKVDPKVDLVPVCPNCHAMLHRGKTTLTVDELKTLLAVT